MKVKNEPEIYNLAPPIKEFYFIENNITNFYTKNFKKKFLETYLTKEALEQASNNCNKYKTYNMELYIESKEDYKIIKEYLNEKKVQHIIVYNKKRVRGIRTEL